MIKNAVRLRINTTFGCIDLLPNVVSVGDYNAVVASSKPIKLGKHTVRVLTLQGLLKALRAGGSRKRNLVIPELEALHELEQNTEPT